jgi:hypothetical protein
MVVLLEDRFAEVGRRTLRKAVSPNFCLTFMLARASKYKQWGLYTRPGNVRLS